MMLFATVSALLIALTGTIHVHPLQTATPLPQLTVSVQFDISNPDSARKQVDYAAELGARYVVFNILWRDIEPERGQFNYTALGIYREIISYMRSKGLQPIVILGSEDGYPEWAKDLIDRYYACATKCYGYHVNVSITFNYTGNSTPEWIRDAVKRSVEAYLKNGGPEIELKTIEYVMKTCPDYYRASAKGFLTREELAEISMRCPALPIKVSSAELERGVVYVKPLPQTYEILKRLVNCEPGAVSIYGTGVPPEAYTMNKCVQQCYNTYISAFLNEAYQYVKAVTSELREVYRYQLGIELKYFGCPEPNLLDTAFIEAPSRG